MRIGVLALAALVLAVGCGTRESREPTSSGAPQRAARFLAGTSDYASGLIRVSFLVIRPNGQSVERRTARVEVLRGGDRIAAATAVLVPTGVAGPTPALYVAHVRIGEPGSYAVVARPAGAGVTAQGSLVVRAHSLAPGVGARAVPSDTPTLATAAVAALTTAKPPDRALLRYSVAESLRVHAPFVLLFATPKFCVSRTCGPVVDVALKVASQFPKVRFIHVEIYEGNDPAKGFNRWAKAWRLPSNESWTFLVGRDGVIKERFAGSMSVAELAAAVRRSFS